MGAKKNIPVLAVVAALNRGESALELSKKYKCTRQTIYNAVSSYKDSLPPVNVEVAGQCVSIYKASKVAKLLDAHKISVDVLKLVLEKLRDSVEGMTDLLDTADAVKLASLGKDVAVIANILIQQQKHFGGGSDSVSDLLGLAAKSAMQSASDAWSQGAIDVTPQGYDATRH